MKCTFEGSQIGFSGAVQKSDVQQRFRRTAPARLTRLLKSIGIEKSDSYCVKRAPLKKRRDDDKVETLCPQESRKILANLCDSTNQMIS
ncbi:hypothetical protein B5B98_05840 [Staphylococcus delphini]|nr:hypothetical protein B5B98_05840 [Staphylococcus delphini]